jgi:hypothetical protein
LADVSRKMKKLVGCGGAALAPTGETEPNSCSLIRRLSIGPAALNAASPNESRPYRQLLLHSRHFCVREPGNTVEYRIGRHLLK